MPHANPDSVLGACPTGKLLEPPDRKRPQPTPPQGPAEPLAAIVAMLPLSELGRLEDLAQMEGLALDDLLHRRLSGCGMRQSVVRTDPTDWDPQHLAEMLLAAVACPATLQRLRWPDQQLAEQRQQAVELVVAAAREGLRRMWL